VFRDNVVSIVPRLLTGLLESESRKGNRFISSQKHSDLLRGPRSFLLNGYHVHFQGQSGQGVKVTIYLYLESRLRISGAVPLLLYGDTCFETWWIDEFFNWMFRSCFQSIQVVIRLYCTIWWTVFIVMYAVVLKFVKSLLSYTYLFYIILKL